MPAASGLACGINIHGLGACVVADNMSEMITIGVITVAAT